MGHQTEKSEETSVSASANAAKESPLNLSKPRKDEPNNNNNNKETEKPQYGTFDEDLANFELLRKRKYFLDQNQQQKSFNSQQLPQLFPTPPALSPKLPHPNLFSPNSGEFPGYPTFRNFPGFENRSAVAAAAVGMLPPMGQPAAGLAALRNSSALGLHQVSMMDQVRHEHQRQQQQQQNQQQQQGEDGLNCTRKKTIYK